MILLAKLKQYNPLDIASARFSFDINIFRGSLYVKLIFSLIMLDEKLVVHAQQIFGNSIKVGKSGGSDNIGYHSQIHHNSSPPHKLAAILADDIFKRIFLNESDRIPIQISLFLVVQLTTVTHLCEGLILYYIR